MDISGGIVIKKYLLNEKIKSKSVRLIGDDGTQHGVVAIEIALNMAKESGLDLMVVSETSDPPVCKIVNFGQFKYQQQKKEKQSQKKSKGQIIKELKLSPKMSENDLNVRVNRGREFLEKGFKLKVSISFRGREIIHPELGRNMMNKFVEQTKDLGTLEGNVSQAGRSLLAFVNPK